MLNEIGDSESNFARVILTHERQGHESAGSNIQYSPNKQYPLIFKPFLTGLVIILDIHWAPSQSMHSQTQKGGCKLYAEVSQANEQQRKCECKCAYTHRHAH